MPTMLEKLTDAVLDVAPISPVHARRAVDAVLRTLRQPSATTLQHAATGARTDKADARLVLQGAIDSVMSDHE